MRFTFINTVAASLLGLVSALTTANAGGDVYPRGSMKDHGAHAYAQQPPAPIWSGFYAGLHGGYGRAEAASGLTLSGGLVGAQVGYLFQRGRMVFGIEGDVSGTGLEKSASATVAGTTTSLKVGIDAIGSVRAIAGVEAGSALLYLTGGLAFGLGGASATVTDGTGTFRAGIDYSMTGFVVGAGIEYRMTPRLSLRGEVLHYSFSELTIERVTDKIDMDATIGRAAINFRFQ